MAQIKDYKEIKANLIELKNDVKSNFYGKNNKQKRIKIASILTLFVLIIFTISAIYLYSQKPKQVIIVSPSDKAILNIWDETVIVWEEIPETVEYFVSIYPTTPGFHEAIEYYQFYVDGNKSGVKIVLGNFIYSTGQYHISVSSDVADTQVGTITVYLVDDLPETEQSDLTDGS